MKYWGYRMSNSGFGIFYTPPHTSLWLVPYIHIIRSYLTRISYRKAGSSEPKKAVSILQLEKETNYGYSIIVVSAKYEGSTNNGNTY